MTPLFSIPDASTLISSTTSYATPWFNSLILIGVVLAGLIIAGMGVAKFVGTIKGAVAKVLGKRGRGRGRRR